MTPRRWIWTAAAAQVVGLVFDAVWHGLLHPGFEAVTVSRMVTHLGTVHLPIYIGVVGVLVATAWALVDSMKRSGTGFALPFAFAGAAVSTAGEAWHAYSHLQLSPHSGPIAEATASFGLVVVVTAVWLSGRRARRRGMTTSRGGVSRAAGSTRSRTASPTSTGSSSDGGRGAW
jgi:hypothetical protein